MKLLSAPRQPFVGLALMAAVGIILAELVPVRSTVFVSAATVLALCILVTLCWPKLAATYLIVATGFFYCTNSRPRTQQASNLRTNLARGRASLQQSDA